jgi:hypothetical protein
MHYKRLGRAKWFTDPPSPPVLDSLGGAQSMISPSAAGRPDFDDSTERRFEPIGRQQCLDLIESHHVGRIAWQAADLPQILPITYAMHQAHLLPYVA